MDDKVFFRARLKLAVIYTLGIIFIFVAGFILNSWLDKVVAEPRVDPALYLAEGATIILVGFVSFYFAGRTLRPAEISYERQKKFTADAAHELRTPLTVMKTGVETTLAGKSSTRAYKKLISESLEEIDYMTGMVNDLLFLAQNDSHKRIELSKIDPARLAGKQIELMRPYAKSKGVVLEYDLQSEMYINGYEAHLKRLIANLLQNAITYNKSGGRVSVSFHKNKQRIELRVTDTGIGISRSDLERIFERFYKADTSRSRQSSGAGLGLAIVKEIVSRHSGHIAIDSQLGKGTSVIISFPIYS